MPEKIECIYIIDDDDIDSEQHHRLIKKIQLNSAVHQFSYSEEALKYLADNNCSDNDLILLDINMPRMNGFEFIENMRNNPNIKCRPVIVMLTTSNSEEDRLRAERYSEVHSYLNKPLDVASLEKLVNDLQR